MTLLLGERKKRRRGWLRGLAFINAGMIVACVVLGAVGARAQERFPAEAAWCVLGVSRRLPFDRVGPRSLTGPVVNVAASVQSSGLRATDSTRASRGTLTLTPPDPWLSRDKGAHFAASAFLASVGYYLARREQNWRDRPSQVFSVSLALAFGVGKELWDRFSRRGQASFRDLVADIVGVTLAVNLVRFPDGNGGVGKR